MLETSAADLKSEDETMDTLNTEKNNIIQEEEKVQQIECMDFSDYEYTVIDDDFGLDEFVKY